MAFGYKEAQLEHIQERLDDAQKTYHQLQEDIHEMQGQERRLEDPEWWRLLAKREAAKINLLAVEDEWSAFMAHEKGSNMESIFRPPTRKPVPR